MLMRVGTLTLALLLVGCSTADLPDEENSLRETAEQVGTLIAAQQWSDAYQFYPDKYRAKCSEEHFIGMWEHTIDTIGMPTDIRFAAGRVRIEGNLGYIYGHWQVGNRVYDAFNGDEAPSFSLVNGDWRVYVSEEELATHRPCDIILAKEIVNIQTTSGDTR